VRITIREIYKTYRETKKLFGKPEEASRKRRKRMNYTIERM